MAATELGRRLRLVRRTIGAAEELGLIKRRVECLPRFQNALQALAGNMTSHLPALNDGHAHADRPAHRRHATEAADQIFRLRHTYVYIRN